MWECNNCGYKNNNSNEKCHGINCNMINTDIDRKDDRILDGCPKCLHPTFWKRSKFHQSYMKANGTMAKKWIKVWKCEECGRHAKLIGSPIKTAEQLSSEVAN